MSIILCCLLQDNTLEPDPDDLEVPGGAAAGATAGVAAGAAAGDGAGAAAGDGAGDGAGATAGDGAGAAAGDGAGAAAGDGAGAAAGDGAGDIPARAPRVGLVSRLSREERGVLEAAFYREGELHITNELIAISRTNVFGFSALWDKMLSDNGGNQRKAIQRARSYFRKKKGPSGG